MYTSLENYPDLLTPKETATCLRMSEAWLARQRWEHKGLPFLKFGNRVFYEKAVVAEWLQSQKQETDWKH